MSRRAALYRELRRSGLDPWEARLAVYNRNHRDKYFPAFKIMEDAECD